MAGSHKGRRPSSSWRPTFDEVAAAPTTNSARQRGPGRAMRTRRRITYPETTDVRAEYYIRARGPYTRRVIRAIVRDLRTTTQERRINHGASRELSDVVNIARGKNGIRLRVMRVIRSVRPAFARANFSRALLPRERSRSARIARRPPTRWRNVDRARRNRVCFSQHPQCTRDPIFMIFVYVGE